MKPTNDELVKLWREIYPMPNYDYYLPIVRRIIERWEEMREERINRDNVPPKEAPT